MPSGAADAPPTTHRLRHTLTHRAARLILLIAHFPRRMQWAGTACTTGEAATHVSSGPYANPEGRTLLRDAALFTSFERGSSGDRGGRYTLTALHAIVQAIGAKSRYFARHTRYTREEDALDCAEVGSSLRRALRAPTGAGVDWSRSVRARVVVASGTRRILARLVLVERPPGRTWAHTVGRMLAAPRQTSGAHPCTVKPD